MPSNEVKQRKKSQSQKQIDSPANGAEHKSETETEMSNTTCRTSSHQKHSSPCPELKTLLCFVSLLMCAVLTWVIQQQNERFAAMEEKYNRLSGKSAIHAELEQRVERLSEKLDASKSRLEGALSSLSTATQLSSDVANLRSIVAAMQTDDLDEVTSSSSSSIQEVNARFLNVTEAWQAGLAAVTTDLAAVREESRASHTRATAGVNEAERRLRKLTERLEELEESTGQNARAFDRTEDADVQQAQRQLDWNTARVGELEEKLARLVRTDQELVEKLEEQVPRAQQCQEQLPTVEEAVRSILRLAAGLTTVERRIEEVGLQVLGLEDSMLRGFTQTLEVRQALDTLRGRPPILEVPQTLDWTSRKEEGTSTGQEIDAILATLQEMELESKKREGVVDDSGAEGRDDKGVHVNYGVGDLNRLPLGGLDDNEEKDNRQDWIADQDAPKSVTPLDMDTVTPLNMDTVTPLDIDTVTPLDIDTVTPLDIHTIGKEEEPPERHSSEEDDV